MKGYKEFDEGQQVRWQDTLCKRDETVEIVKKVADGLFLARLQRGFYSADGNVFVSFLVVHSDHLYSIKGKPAAPFTDVDAAAEFIRGWSIPVRPDGDTYHVGGPHGPINPYSAAGLIELANDVWRQNEGVA